ncbi:MAG: protein-methionine-sulfoxide reductase heme-binding subunit MsrQ [Alphaproteobacteria bacterium]|nr:protein-methionine-sulfoxide reductase heme-binding subunit MsrQ [Alphaproteobacteria bacterium]
MSHTTRIELPGLAPLLSPTIIMLLAIPAIWLGLDGATGGLGVRPWKQAVHDSGWWAIWMLLAALSITPIRRLTGWSALARIRREVGVASFCYAALHLVLHAAEQNWRIASIAVEIVARPYLTLGALAWVILAALAVTSTDGWVKRLGRHWRRLHRLVWIAVAAGLAHYLLQVRFDPSLPMAAIALAVWLWAVRRLGAGAWRAALGAGCAIAFAAALGEAAWYAASRAVPVPAMLAANLDPTLGLRPAHWVMAITGSIAITAAVVARMRPPRRNP